MSVEDKGGRPSGEKTRCSGQWTEARFRSFVKGNLRRVCNKWAPITDVKKEARVSRGQYLCAGCRNTVPNSVVEDGKRVNNIFVDHINPIVDPSVGWTNWDDVIEGMFSEKDNLQLLCKDCHDVKTKEERDIAVERRRKEKESK